MDGLKIREARKAAKMTQNQLAQAVGINRATLSKYESGIIDPPLSQLLRISEVLNASISFLVGVSDEKRRLFPEHLTFISPDEEELVKSLLPHSSELDPLSDEELALKILLNSTGNDILKANGIYFFKYEDGGSIVSESDIKNLLNCAKNGLEIAAKTLELKLRQEAYKFFDSMWGTTSPAPPTEPPQKPPKPQEGKQGAEK